MRVQFVFRRNGKIVERGKEYDVMSMSHGWYRIDDGHEPALYPPRFFDIIDPEPTPPEEEIPNVRTEDDLRRYVKEQYGLDDVEFETELVGKTDDVTDNDEGIALLIDDRVFVPPEGYVPIKLSKEAQRELDAEIDEIDRKAKLERANHKRSS
jgi:hypothetical protein